MLRHPRRRVRIGYRTCSRVCRSAGAICASVTLAAALGCIQPPPRPSGQQPPGLASEVLELLIGVVVDVNAESGAFLLKAQPDYETWTVSIDDGSRIVDTDGTFLPLGRLAIGDQVRVRGRSRTGGFLTALEVNLERKATP